ncbi:proteasome complex subunit Sem1 [Aspergillus sp. HF37]|nr:proteasome complex subunit Sem1 [Aspergillus sp. HF37]
MSNTQSQSQSQPQDQPSQQPQQQKPFVLEEDDEFEDFPIEDWPAEEAEQPSGAAANGGNNVHLWEESWDDDDAAEDFSKQLKDELKKVDAAR